MLAATSATAAPGELQIAAGPLGTALTQLAAASGVDLLFTPADVADRRILGLKGRMSVDAALQRLLEGSGLAFRRTADQYYVIYRLPDAPVAQQALPDIIVTGRRTQDADIRRTRNDIQPYRVAGAREIAEARSDNVDEFLRTRMPSNAVLSSPAQNPAAEGGSNRSSIDLHGLGSEQTLILIDGLRLPGLPTINAGFYQPDLNGLPIGQIDRIETLTATAGGIYGPGATGGVVNVVLRRDYRGADLTLDTSLSQGGGGSRRRIEARLGFTPDHGTTDVMVAASRQQVSDLNQGQRTLTERANAQAIAISPSLYFETQPVSDAIIVSGTNLSFTPTYGGGALGAPVSYLPIGGPGDPATVAAQLQANAGKLPSTLSTGMSGRGASLLAASSASSLLTSVRHRFGASVEGFVDLIVMKNDGHATTSGLVPIGILSPQAANNPFKQFVTISLPLPVAGFFTTTHIRTTRATAGLLMDLPGGWKANGSFGVGGVRRSAKSTGTVLIVFDLIDGSPPLNPFGDWQTFLEGVASQNTSRTTLTDRPQNDFADANLRMAGPLARLPGGDMTATLLLEHRREHQPSSIETITSPGHYDRPAETVLPDILQLTRSAYGELRAPLIPFDKKAGPLRGLEVQAALRFDASRIDVPSFFDPATGNGVRVSARYDTLSYTAGVRFFPVCPLMLRASIATGNLPPTASQIGTTRAQVEVREPLRGNRFEQIYVLRGGSVRLSPALARTISVGAVLNPTAGRWPRLSIDYVRLDVRREVASLSPYGNMDINYFLMNAGQYPDRVVRAPLTDAERALGLTLGALQHVDATALNVGLTRVQAIDMDLDWTVALAGGQLLLHAAGTWQPELNRTAGLGAPSVKHSGYSDGPLTWRANGSAEWSSSWVSAGISGQFYDRYRVQSSADGILPSVLTLQGSDYIPAQFYLDLNASLRVRLGNHAGQDRSALFRVGITNLLNSFPPVVISNFSGPGYSMYGDPRLRRISLTVSTKF